MNKIFGYIIGPLAFFIFIASPVFYVTYKDGGAITFVNGTFYKIWDEETPAEHVIEYQQLDSNLQPLNFPLFPNRLSRDKDGFLHRIAGVCAIRACYSQLKIKPFKGDAELWDGFTRVSE